MRQLSFGLLSVLIFFNDLAGRQCSVVLLFFVVPSPVFSGLLLPFEAKYSLMLLLRRLPVYGEGASGRDQWGGLMGEGGQQGRPELL